MYHKCNDFYKQNDQTLSSNQLNDKFFRGTPQQCNTLRANCLTEYVRVSIDPVIHTMEYLAE